MLNTIILIGVVLFFLEYMIPGFGMMLLSILKLAGTLLQIVFALLLRIGKILFRFFCFVSRRIKSSVH